MSHKFLLYVVYLDFDSLYFTSNFIVHCLYLLVEGSHHFSHELNGLLDSLLVALFFIVVAA
jgi:hypothetical protein